MAEPIHCLGVPWLSHCAYNPAAPSSVYFSIGDGVAALSLLLLIPQFMRRLHKFRLAMRRVSETRIYIIAMASFLVVVFASAVPQLPLETLIGWPVFWEILAGLGFFSAYALLASAHLIPVRVRRGNAEAFAQSAASFLAHATPADHVDFAPELRRNIGRFAQMIASVNFKRAEQDAIYSFTYRRDLQAARYSSALLGVLADPAFCRSLVDRCPWDVAAIANGCQPVTRRGGVFIQQLARQAIRSEDGILSREMDYSGFRRAPVFSTALFGNHRLNELAVPFRGLRWDDFDGTCSYIERVNYAALVSLKAVFVADAVNEATNLYNLIHHYDSVVLRARSQTVGEPDVSRTIRDGLVALIRETRRHLAGLTPERRRELYSTADNDHGAIDAVAKLVVDFWEAISNGFSDHADQYWIAAHDTWEEAFPAYPAGPSGMDPLQQRIAMKLRKTVDGNMDGRYPALSRLMLSMLGPFQPSSRSDLSALGLVRIDFFHQLRRLPELARSHAEKVGDFLPPGMVFEPAGGAIVHMERSGARVRTDTFPTTAPSFAPESDAL